MKTTVEIPDPIYRQIKVCAALQGQTVRASFLDAVQEKLQRSRGKPQQHTGWRSVFGKASAEDVDDIQRVIDEEFSQIEMHFDHIEKVRRIGW